MAVSETNYVFLTGATGLLGSHILWNCLERGEHVAVLARPCKKESAEKRIAAILHHFETETGKTIRPPRIFSGNLLNPAWIEQNSGWFADHCRSIIHCAASLTFYGAEDDEPYRSNVGGTEQILKLAQKAGIDEMHYVSTAYVAGSSTHFTENDLDRGQELRNDYEKSKFCAEKMVRSAGFKDLTVYRPSIVVGNSQTGYTATFHGFYAVLKLAHTLVQRMPLGSTSGRGLLAALGLSGAERKNFVPVDWVTAVFDHIYRHREHHCLTYHLTTPEPPLLTDFVDMVQDAVETYSKLANTKDRNIADEGWFFANYFKEVQIYKAYLQDDPQFDSSNTQSAAPHLPCPMMDKELMLFLARYAILSQFGKLNKVKPVKAKKDALVAV
ncbi:MAG: SDR family oxidoreductase [Planctomycetaceae bacterium]|jgi:thioester reductase-like protein|nr:SDR family oxidoreductase [Planctomycetaceae bacterium]